MSTLSGTKIKDTYSGLLKTTDNAALSGTFKAITDGAGNNSGLELNTTYARATNGMLFGADTAAANVLDDYEKGTWTPVFSSNGGGESISFYANSGNYVKIGNMVSLGCIIGVSSVSGGSGDLKLGGIPFAAANSSFSGSFSANNFAVGFKNPSFRAGTSFGFLGSDNNGGVWSWALFNSITAGTEVLISITYSV